jgi:hypothetical protein
MEMVDRWANSVGETDNDLVQENLFTASLAVGGVEIKDTFQGSNDSGGHDGPVQQPWNGSTPSGWTSHRRSTG